MPVEPFEERIPVLRWEEGSPEKAVETELAQIPKPLEQETTSASTGLPGSEEEG